jgi:hypothetical protein
VKKRLFVTGVAVAILVLVMIVSACSQGGTTATTTKPGATNPGATVQEPIKKVINPQGSYIPVETKACAPRIDSLNGKRILYYESEATNMHMPTLLVRLKKDYPTAIFDVVHTEAFGSNTPTEQQIKDYTGGAVIRGVGW